jgi:hypothetical protein
MDVQPKTRLFWTPEETEYLKAGYGKFDREQLQKRLPRFTWTQIKAKACTLHLLSKKYWVDADLQWLSDNVGLVSPEELSRHLQRSIAGIRLVCKRRLHINYKTNLYTARNLAGIFGVKCAKTVTRWHRLGWLKGERSPISCGGGRMWHFDYDNIVDFVRNYPWLFDTKRMEQSYFRTIVLEEYARRPWVTYPQACKMVHVAYDGPAMAQYIKKKWLHPVKKPIEGGNHWTWIFFKSDIEKFLANDPRCLYGSVSAATKKAHRLKEGKPVQLHLVWRMRCPVCRHMVRIEAYPRYQGKELQELFRLRFCGDGKCTHGRKVKIERPLKPYKVRESKGGNGDVHISGYWNRQLPGASPQPRNHNSAGRVAQENDTASLQPPSRVLAGTASLSGVIRSGNLGVRVRA